MYDPLGLSIGTTNLVAAGNGGPPVTRRAVLTLYPHCAPKIGVPSQNPNLIEPGALMSGFVERIGDAVALVSPDGSVHDPDLLLVEALDAMVLTAGADASSSEIAIAVPAHWKPGAVHALRNGLRTHVGFVRSGMAPRLVSDAIAALTAVNSNWACPTAVWWGCLISVAPRLTSPWWRPSRIPGRRISSPLVPRHGTRTFPVVRSTRLCCFGSSTNSGTAMTSIRPVPPRSGNSANSGSSAVRQRNDCPPTLPRNCSLSLPGAARASR